LDLGVIICQMLTGNMNITKNDFQDTSLFNISKEAKQLINNILAKKYQEIKKKSFFKTINWIKLEKCQIKPPFKPEIVNITYL
jgi:hypothetical protein